MPTNMSKNINSLQDLDGDDYAKIRTDIQRMILDMYLPAENPSDAEEFITNADLLDTMRSMMEMEGEFLFSIMKELNFKTKLIGDTVYWMVKYSS
jgi:hypothetical protein